MKEETNVFLRPFSCQLLSPPSLCCFHLLSSAVTIFYTFFLKLPPSFPLRPPLSLFTFTSPFCISCSWADSHCRPNEKNIHFFFYLESCFITLLFFYFVMSSFTGSVNEDITAWLPCYCLHSQRYFTRDMLSGEKKATITFCSSNSILPLPSSLPQLGFVCSAWVYSSL